MSSPWTDDLVPGGGPRVAPGPPASPPPAWNPPAGGSGLSGAIAALAVVLLLGVLAIPVSSFVRGEPSFWPTHWDPRIAPITQRDQQLRGLDYEHPVPVRFLSEKDFVKLVGGADSPNAADTAEVEREAATFRALGLISGQVDLPKVTKQADEAGVLAFYDFDKKEIVVRGTTLDVSHRATLAHELTHVLQDQHFDLRAIEDRAGRDDLHTGGSSGAMLALIEGDANNVMDGYLKGLSAADRKEYNREQNDQGNNIGKATVGVPAFIELLFSAPYDLGPLTIRVLKAGGGNSAVNAALTGPTPTSADFTQAGLVVPPPPDLAAPTLTAGEQADGKPESFGPFETYLMLAARSDAASALTTSDAVEGGRAQGFRSDGRYCYRAALEIRDTAAAGRVAAALRQWEKSATGATLTQSGTSVTFTACDPGKRGVGPSAKRLSSAELLLGGRSGVAVGAAEKGVPPDTARCVARLFARNPNAITLLDQAGSGTLSAALTARVQAQVRQEALECRDNPDSGLL